MTLIFSCAAENDLYTAYCAANGPAERIADPVRAVGAAPPGAGVLLLADDYPQRRAEVPAEIWAAAAAGAIRLYVEFPAAVPGLSFDPPRTAGWERLVVNDPALTPALRERAILAAHACVYLPVTTAEPGLVSVARVAGYDHAEFGRPDSATPALLQWRGALVATTKLSHFRTGRYAPVASWNALWEGILRRLDPDAPVRLQWTPTVAPSYRADHPVGPELEAAALDRFVDWHRDGEVLLTAVGERSARELIPVPTEAAPRERLDTARGDGRFGLLEGYESQIQPDGRQHARVALRADCIAEAAMVLAVAGRESDVATNLLDYLYGPSGLCGGDRADPEHPSFGHIGWGVGSRPWEIANYGDDNARTILASLLVSARGDEPDRWLESILRAILANLRTTGRRGFRGDRIDQPELIEHGWRHFHDRDNVNFSAHFEGYLWACYVWAFRVTGRPELRDCAVRGCTEMMAAFPDRWRRNDLTERARMLLPLAWLVRVADTPTHRGWLATVAEDLVRDQQASGAIGERELGGAGLFQAPQRNEDYGVTESPLIQHTGDPASDQLYTTGFALLGLHEAAAATGDARLGELADRLAGYLVRIQTTSTTPALSGTWLRGFDYQRWDFYASSGDLGWGAWCVEVGWAPAWGALALGLRGAGRSLWDEVTRVRPGPELTDRLCTQMQTAPGR